jgi:hypothetical protein
MHGAGSTSGDNQNQATSMQRAIIAPVRGELVKQHQDGGMFSFSVNSRGRA